MGDTAIIELPINMEKNSSVYWTTPEKIITNTNKIKTLKQGKHFVKITSDLYPQPEFDSVFVKFILKPKRLLRDTILCKGKTMLLDAKNSGMRYKWNTGENTQKIKIESQGTYWVKINNGKCELMDTVIIKSIQNPAAPNTQEIVFCMNDENKILNLKYTSYSKVEWNTGAKTTSIQAIKEGTYWVKSVTSNCGERTDTIKVKLKVCDCELLIPNSFTPNEDNRNDYFFPVLSCDYSYFLITITDRWSNVVFNSTSHTAKWDGRYKGNLCPEDVYFYKIETIEKNTDKKNSRSGKISLFR